MGKTSRKKPLVKAPTPQGLTLDRITRRFATDDAARAYLEGVRWPNGPVCPHCRNADPDRIYKLAENAERKIRPGLYECAPCRKQFTVTVGTVFEDSHIPLRKWLIAWYLLCSSKKGVSALYIQRALELGSYRSAWFMMHRIRYALRDQAFGDKLSGVVEVDETYIGGRTRGTGHGYKGNKVPVVSLVERGGRVRSHVVRKVTGISLASVLREQMHPTSVLITDELRGYRPIGRTFLDHQTVNHSKKEFSYGGAHTNTVEGYFANLKRGLDGVYHHVGQQYLGQYLAEFDFRYNERKVSDGSRTLTGLAKAEGKRMMLRKPKVQVKP